MTCWPGERDAEDFLPHRLFLDALDQLLDDPEMNVGFEQSDTDLAQGGFHVLGR